METKTYILKLQTDNKDEDNIETLENVLTETSERGRLVAYSFKELELPKLDEEN